MKQFIKDTGKIGFRILMVSILIITACFFYSCEKEESYGVPEITNVRVTDPDQADVTLTEANLGQMIVIQGRNLGSLLHLYFNDVEAFFIPTLVTNTSIIITIPSTFPTEINNQIRVVTKGGETTYNFVINIPAPVVNDFPLEWVNEGDVLTIRGQYFHSIESVVFTGDVEGAVVDVTPNELRVSVPEGAESGPVTVNALAGSGVSKAWFRDNRNMFIDFGEYWLCWGGNDYVIDAGNIPANVPVEPINGNFYYIKKDYAGETWWIEETVLAYCGDQWVNGNPANLALAFEMWVGEKWDNNWFEIIMEPGWNLWDWKGYETYGGDDNSLSRTGWMTVKIPLANMGVEGDSFQYQWMSFKAAEEATIEFAFDNIRIVPIN
jgi:hypothetical protein